MPENSESNGEDSSRTIETTDWDKAFKEYSKYLNEENKRSRGSVMLEAYVVGLLSVLTYGVAIPLYLAYDVYRFKRYAEKQGMDFKQKVRVEEVEDEE